MPKRKVLIAVLLIVTVVIFVLISFFRAHYVLPILMYHSVSAHPSSENRIAVSVKSFERQMFFLKKHHYHVITLEKASDIIREKKKVPPKTVVITFDDGYKNAYTYSYHILKKYNFPATMFIIVNEVGRAKNDRLSWEEIKKMRDSGLITFGSHCLGPEPLINIKSEKQIKKEIFDSKKILEAKLGKPVAAFSYPEGRFNPKIRKLVIDAGYKMAVATNPGKGFPNDDTFALKRLRIGPTSDSLFVFFVESSGYYNVLRENRRKGK